MPDPVNNALDTGEQTDTVTTFLEIFLERAADVVNCSRRLSNWGFVTVGRNSPEPWTSARNEGGELP